MARCISRLHVLLTCYTQTHTRWNSKQSLLRLVPCRQTSAKIKPLWSKNTKQAREPKTGWRRQQAEERGGEGWCWWWWQGETKIEDKGKQREKRKWGCMPAFLISFWTGACENAWMQKEKRRRRYNQQPFNTMHLLPTTRWVQELNSVGSPHTDGLSATGAFALNETASLQGCS